MGSMSDQEKLDIINELIELGHVISDPTKKPSEDSNTEAIERFLIDKSKDCQGLRVGVASVGAFIGNALAERMGTSYSKLMSGLESELSE